MATGRADVRFGKIILDDPPSADMEVKAAVKEVNDVLDAPRGVGKHVPGFLLKKMRRY